MNKYLCTTLAISVSCLSAIAQAAPGEYWEVTNKMEMPGMPFSMPATTTKVCLSKGGENDPRKTSGDKNCQMSDIKTVGKKTSYKVHCNHDGEVMDGRGEQTITANGYEGKIQFSGQSRGRDMNMSMVFSGKRIGGSCDSEEVAKKAKAQLCDTSRYESTADWISGADLFLQAESPCVEQRKKLCELVRKDAPKDAKAYNALLAHDQQPGNTLSVARECKVDVAAATRAICKTLNEKNYSQLSGHCPAEAKAYREVQRRKECEGRSYTAETRAEDIRKCMSGGNNEDADAPSGNTRNSRPSSSHKTESTDDSASGSTTSSDLLNGAKKLKGLFGY